MTARDQLHLSAGGAAAGEGLLPAIRPFRRAILSTPTRPSCAPSTSANRPWKRSSSTSFWPRPRPARWWWMMSSSWTGSSASEIAAAANDAKDRKLAGKVGNPAAEHHPAARSPVADRPRRAREAVQRSAGPRPRRATPTTPAPPSRKSRSCAPRRPSLLGYPNYAAYTLFDQMAETPDKVETFLRPSGARHGGRGKARSQADCKRDRQGGRAFSI